MKEFFFASFAPSRERIGSLGNLFRQAPSSNDEKKILVIGLDSLEPSLVFDRWWNDLPNLRKLAESGSYERIKSCDPPITVPAWSVMTTGCDPVQLGCYGFRNRKDYSYAPLVVANASAIKQKRVWAYLSDAGYQVIVLGVPQTYPPRPVNGCLVSCFLAPSTGSVYTHPASLAEVHERLRQLGYV